VFGARSLLMLEARFARAILQAWDAGCSSLLVPLGIDARYELVAAGSRGA
jgi:hypothetical protein